MEKKAHLIQQLNMCQAFQASGEDVCFVSPGTREPSWEFISEYYGLSTKFELKAASTFSKNHSFPNYPIPDMDDQAVTYWLLYMLLSGKFGSNDIIYSRNFTPTRYFLSFRKRTRLGRDIPVWFEQHQVDRGAELDFYDQLNGLVCISELQKQRMLEIFPMDEEKITVAHDGVDLEGYSEISTEQARDYVGLDPDERIVMYTGHLYESKGVETLVRAAGDFDARCYIVGGYDEDIARIKDEVSVPNNVTFTGFVSPAKIPYYQMAADVLVATVADTTGEYEFFSPLKIFEYMAAAKPLVVSLKPSYEEMLTHDRNCLFVEPGSVTALSGAINNLLSDPALRLELGRQARIDVQRYSWNSRARRVLSQIKDRC